MKKSRAIFQKILRLFSDVFIPSKISSPEVEGKKNSFSRILELIKYEREKIPLPKVTLPKLHDYDKRKEKAAHEESAFQHYYLYQFVNVEKQKEFQRRRENNQKKLISVISFMHFLSMTYPMSRIRSGPAMNLCVYNPTVQSVTFGKNKEIKK